MMIVATLVALVVVVALCRSSGNREDAGIRQWNERRTRRIMRGEHD